MIVTDTDSHEIQRRLLNEWGGLIDTVYNVTQFPQIHAQIPSSWLRLADTSCTNVIAELWSKARGALPRFVDYLSQSTLAMIVADGSIGLTLIYHIKDWEETDIAQYKDGFMLAGLPTPIEHIDAFEQSIGKIPSSLRRLWQVHGFLLLKDGAFLSSLDPTLEEFCGSPKVLGLRKVSYDPKEQYDCLAIANAWKELPFCLTKKPDTFCWEDFIVLADRNGEKVSPAGRTRIDDLLTDWTFSEWGN